MRPLILFLALIVVLFLLGVIAVHTLVWVALVALVVWLVLVMVRPHGRGRRWHGSSAPPSDRASQPRGTVRMIR
jgi:fatty acid desaturase